MVLGIMGHDDKGIEDQSRTISAPNDQAMLERQTEEKRPAGRRTFPNFISGSLRARLAVFALTFLIFLSLWQLIASLTNNSLILAKPLPVFQALVNLLQDNVPRATEGLQNPTIAIVQTLEIVFLGFGLAAIVGIPIGILEGRWNFAAGIIDPWIDATHSIPIVALIPTLYFAIGGSFFAFVFIAFLLAVFSIIVNTQSGVKYSIGFLSDVGRSFRASELQFISKIVLPASMPDIITGLRVGLGRAILGAVLAQALLSGNGLGGMIVTFQDLYATPYTMATLLLIAVLGILVLQLPKQLEKRIFKGNEIFETL